MSDEFQNPIDPDKITENPHSLEYAHQMKGLSVSAMEHQTDMQLGQIYEQMQLLADQAKKLQDRKLISERIYQAEMRFKPVINHIYHVYYDEAKKYLLSLIEPNQWGHSGKQYTYVATVRLLADHTWDILEKNPEAEL